MELRIYRLDPSASCELYKGPRTELNTLCRSSMAMTSVLTSGQWGYPIQGLGSYGGEQKRRNLALCRLLPNNPHSCRRRQSRHSPPASRPGRLRASLVRSNAGVVSTGTVRRGRRGIPSPMTPAAGPAPHDEPAVVRRRRRLDRLQAPQSGFVSRHPAHRWPFGWTGLDGWNAVHTITISRTTTGSTAVGGPENNCDRPTAAVREWPHRGVPAAQVRARDPRDPQHEF